MRAWRLIEYEAPDGDDAWLTRTLAHSIDGTYELPNGCTITARQVDVDYDAEYGDEYVLYDMNEARQRTWTPDDAERRQKSRGDV